MSTRAVVGLQWGDEGKGKLIDVLSAQAQVVVRYQGGANAGHTLVVEGKKHVGHLVPSGIFRPEARCVISNGVVVDLAALLEEIELLVARGVDLAGRLFLSDRAHLVMPWHRVRERLEGERERIGTTGRGIGPCYTDKAARAGLRVCDLYEPDDFARRVAAGAASVAGLLAAAGEPPLDAARIVNEHAEHARRLAPYVADTFELLQQALAEGKQILLEGAQGTMLDLDFGTYPYLTSSNASACGISSGSGIAPRHIDQVVGVMKAYATRVGEGPFPTELADPTGNRLRERGGEYGATTGRPRRCGWLDLVAARYAIRLNGVSRIALTKLDVLSGFPEVRVAEAYEIDGERTERFPASAARLFRARPVWRTFRGWSEEIGACRKVALLPAAAREFLDALEGALGAPLGWISVGADREAMLER